MKPAERMESPSPSVVIPAGEILTTELWPFATFAPVHMKT